jgi:hypothetical protein
VVCCRSCVVGLSQQRSAREYGRWRGQQRAEMEAESSRRAAAAAEPWRERVRRLIGRLGRATSDAGHEEAEEGEGDAAASALWREQMAAQAAAGNLDLGDLAEVSSLPTLVRLLDIPPLRAGVCRTLVRVAEGAGVPPRPVCWARLLRKLVRPPPPAPEGQPPALAQPGPGRGVAAEEHAHTENHEEEEAAAEAAAEAIAAWAGRVEPAAAAEERAQASSPRPPSGKLHWWSCPRCSHANEIHHIDAHPFSWLAPGCRAAATSRPSRSSRSRRPSAEGGGALGAGDRPRPSSRADDDAAAWRRAEDLRFDDPRPWRQQSRSSPRRRSCSRLARRRAVSAREPPSGLVDEQGRQLATYRADAARPRLGGVLPRGALFSETAPLDAYEPWRVRTVELPGVAATGTHVRVRVEVMGSHKCGIVGKYQSVLIMINPMISPRTRMCARMHALLDGTTWARSVRSGVVALPPRRIARWLADTCCCCVRAQSDSLAGAAAARGGACGVVTQRPGRRCAAGLRGATKACTSSRRCCWWLPRGRRRPGTQQMRRRYGGVLFCFFG